MLKLPHGRRSTLVIRSSEAFGRKVRERIFPFGPRVSRSLPDVWRERRGIVCRESAEFEKTAFGVSGGKPGADVEEDDSVVKSDEEN